MRKLLAGLAVCFVLLWAPLAQAADTFVAPAPTGSDANSCLAEDQPCQTIGAGIAKAGSGDTVRVAEGTYEEAQLVTNGRSLRASGAAASTFITPEAAMTALVVTNGTASSVEGFTIQCDVCSVAQIGVNVPGTMRGNIFDGDASDAMALSDLAVTFGSGAVTVDQNVFTDPTTTDEQTAINVNSADQPTIINNQITGFFHGIDIDRAAAGTIIRGNTISQTHNTGTVGAAITGSPAGNDPANDNVAPTIVANTIDNPINVGGINPVPAGITLAGDANAAAPTFGATLRRNRILGHNPAVRAGNTDGAVTLDSDLLVGAPDGLSAFANSTGNALGDVTATNVTAVGGSRAIVLQNTNLTLDSSIVSNSIQDMSGTETSCTISFSRGTTGSDPPVGNGCDDFATGADPQFVDAAAGNYHLQSTSPLVDAGNPLDPGMGALDFDGDARALAGRCGWTVRRDMGADEVTPCAPVGTTIDSGPGEGSLTNSTAAVLSFSNPVAAGFECSVDGAPFASCTSPLSLNGLAEGSHSVAVRGTDDLGNLELSPVTRTWQVDLTPPDTQIDSGPADGSLLAQSAANFGFSSEAGASFECSLDSAAFAPCGSPAELAGLTEGSHTFAVRARDAAGNLDGSPASRAIQVDTAAPQTTISRVRVRGKAARLKFTANELASFDCSLDGREFRPCSSPKRYGGLFVGRHVLRVRATDAAGNMDATPARKAVRIKKKRRQR